MTVHGNLKSPGYARIIEWMSKTWQEFSSHTIIESFRKCGITAFHDENLHSALRQMIEKSETFKDYVINLESSDELDAFDPDNPEIFEDGLPDGLNGGDGLDEPVEIEEDDEDKVEDPNYLASTDDDSCSDSNDDENDYELI